MNRAAEKRGDARMCFYVPAEGHIDGQGYRVAIVTENEPGYRPSGNWPYNGKPGQVLPWFWGHDYDQACAIARRKNAERGLSDEDVEAIIDSSIAAQLKEKPAKRKRKNAAWHEIIKAAAAKLDG